MHLLEEVPLRVRGVNAPPVVDEHVENAKHHNKEPCRPLRLEADRHHDARREADDRHEQASDAPGTTEDKSDEEENEEDTPCKQEAVGVYALHFRSGKRANEATHYFLRSFSERVGRPAKSFLRVYIESLKTMRRPPITLRLRRKKFRSKMRP